MDFFFFFFFFLPVSGSLGPFPLADAMQHMVQLFCLEFESYVGDLGFARGRESILLRNG